MKITRLGFYSTTENIRSQFVSAAEAFSQSWYVKDQACGTAEKLAEFITDKKDPDHLLFFGTEATGENLLAELNQLANVCSPDSEVYVFSPERDVFIYREIMNMGAAGFEGLPIDIDYIAQSTSKFLNTEGSGKLIVGASTLAGVGFSTAFLNIASRCAYKIGAQNTVSLIDGDYTGGITNLFVPQNPKTFVQFEEASTSDIFKGSVKCENTRHDNFQLFPAPAKLLNNKKISNTFLEIGLPEVTQKSEYTFVDFGLFDNLWGCQAIEFCDQILLGTRPTLNGIRIIREVIQNVIDTQGAVEKISCLIIGGGRARKSELSLKKIKDIMPNVAIYDVPDMPSYIFSNESDGKVKLQSKRPKNKYEKSIDKISSSLIG